jgi:indole-3-glycerol phosphate synthase
MSWIPVEPAKNSIIWWISPGNAAPAAGKDYREFLMHSLLKQILDEKRREIRRLRKKVLLPREHELPARRDFKAALCVPERLGLIAEIKFASPSAGVIHKKTDPCSINLLYEEADASAVSFITDKRFFGGDLERLPLLKRAISLPILRKDFIMEEIQVKESYLYGADAVLLIARILSGQELRELLALCRALGMAPLTEVHDEYDLEKAIDCGAEIIGINNRDLDTFEVDLQTTFDLAPMVPEGHIIVSESGIGNRKDLKAVKEAGVHAVLLGTCLMKSKDIGIKVKEMTGGDHRQGEAQYDES